MNYDIIQTGSDGNATVIDDKILIDCGVAYKKLEHYIPELRLVLLTHEHSDHFRKSTVRRIAKERPALRWACRHWMVPALVEAGVDKRNIDVLSPDCWYTVCWDTFGENAVKISPFDTIHDAPNCGWRIWRGQQDSIFYATDLRSLGGIEAKGYGVYLLEANYREADLQDRLNEKLDAGEFAYETRAQFTHLSWEQAMEWLKENMAKYSVWVPMHQHKERETNDGREENAIQEDNG